MAWECEQIGACTLYRGNCWEVLPTLGAVDAVMTDPPWNNGRFLDDQKPWEVYAQWLKHTVDLCSSLTQNQCWFLGTRCLPYVAHHFQEWQCFASIKNFSQMRPSYLPNCWDFAFIRIAYGYKGTGRNWYMSNTAGILSERTGHPTPRGLDVVLYILNMFQWFTILDPFMGSGTTAIACMQLNRAFIGIEIEPRYFDMACHRIEQALHQGILFSAEALSPAVYQERLFA